MEEKACGEYVVHREVLDELRLSKVAQKGARDTKPPLVDRVKESLRCSAPRLKSIVVKWVPVVDWLPRYSIRDNAVGDLVSGISVGIMHLPQGMAYALLASLGPVYGLYSSFYPVLVYFIFGTSRHISVGTFAVISIMIGTVTENLAPDSNFIINGTNGTGKVNITARDDLRIQIASSMALLAGIFQILLGVIRFGFVVTYLSEPLVRGYTTASACHVCVSQLKYLFGISPARFTGPVSLIYIVVDICRLLPQTRVPELVVSLVALTVLIVVKELNHCYRHKLPLPIPIELVVIVLATVIVHFCELRQTYNLDVVGEIPTGINSPRAPDVALFSQILSDAFAVAIVGYATNISLGKTFAVKYGYKVDSNQELVALGLCNSISSFFQCYPVTCSLSRSLVQETTGGKTQVAGVISSILVLITVLKIGSLFEDLPKAVLATIVFVNLKGLFKQFMDVYNLWKTNKVDLLVWLVTFVSTILLNLDLGLAVSIAFSMLTVILRAQQPRYAVLGHLPGTDLYLDTDSYIEAKELPGIKIFRSSATVNYTNAEMYMEALQEKCGIELGKLLTAKRKREDKLKRKQEKEKKKEKRKEKKAKKAAAHMSNGEHCAAEFELNEEKGSVAAITKTDASTNDLNNKGQTNWAYQHDAATLDSDSDPGYHGNGCVKQAPRHGDEETGRPCASGAHSIILDMSTTSYADTATVNTLKSIYRDFGEVNIEIYLSGCQACVVEQLETGGLFSESVPKSRLFVTVHDAVLHVVMKTGQRDDALDIACITQM